MSEGVEQSQGDRSDESLVSLSSSESEHGGVSDEEEDLVLQTSSTNLEGEEHETSEHAPPELESSDDWLKVEHSSVPSPSAPLPVLGRSASRDSGSGSHASSERTVEILSTSNYRDSSLLEEPLAIEQSVTSLEDSETEKPEPEVDMALPDVEPLTSVSGTSLPLSELMQDGSVTEESLAAGSEEQRLSQEGGASGSEVSGPSGKPDSGRMSPYLMINKTGNVAKVTEFESPGLLYAKPTSKKLVQDLTPDEVAQDALEGYEEASQGEEEQSSEVTEGTEGAEPEEYEVGLADGIVPIDPDVLVDLERRAKLIAENLNQVMGGLRNSLHAMTVCSKQSIQLHRESVDNLHTVVDANIKAMYVFMSKFEELHKSLGPLQQIAAQIQEVDIKLKVLERHFRTT